MPVFAPRKPSQGEQIIRRHILNTRIEPLAAYIAATLEDFALNPSSAGKHRAALPAFGAFDSARHIAVVALHEALIRLSEVWSLQTYCQALGRAIELETRSLALKDHDPITYQRMRKTFSSKRAIVSKPVLKALHIEPPHVTNRTRLLVGAFLVDAMLQSIDILEIRPQRMGARTGRVVVPSPEAEALLRAAPPAETLRGALPKAEAPPPWEGLWSDPSLPPEDSALVVLPPWQRNDRDCYRWLDEGQAQLADSVALANAMQATPLYVDPVMAGIEREAWDAGILGLYPCGRYAKEIPSLGGEVRPKELYKFLAREKEGARNDAIRWRMQRVQIERKVQAAEVLAGQAVYYPVQLDFRGRCYTRGSTLSYQGAERERAVLSFAEGGPVDEEGRAWIFSAVASHFGLDKRPFKERVAWAEASVPMLRSVVEAPLDRLELWRDCSDPWLFLQAARALVQHLDDPGAPCGLPIRMDQTMSGLGILAGLLRDERLAAGSNLIGGSRADLYLEVLEGLNQRLLEDLHSEEPYERQMAEQMLRWKPDRKLVKKVVMPEPYGISYMVAADLCADWVEEHVGFVPFDRFKDEIGIPARYLASRLWEARKPVLGDTRRIDRWLRACVVTVIKAGADCFRWTNPAGFPVVVAARTRKTGAVATQIAGKATTLSVQWEEEGKGVSAEATRKGIGPNYVHSMDAGLMALVARAMREQARPMLAVHDCFAVRPCDAAALKETLHSTIRGMFQTDWLDVTWHELQSQTEAVVPRPPDRGELDPRRIGENEALYG